MPIKIITIHPKMLKFHPDQAQMHAEILDILICVEFQNIQPLV
jgi:hypothetical protein